MGKRIMLVRPQPEVQPRTGKKRDRGQTWRPSRNALLEQIMPMPPATYRKGRSTKARHATFDPLRGGFVTLSNESVLDPTVQPPVKRMGIRPACHVQTGDQARNAMAANQAACLPTIHKRRPPEGTRLDNDLGAGLQVHDVTPAEEKAMWEKYQDAMERALHREGPFESLTWRHRATKAPALPLQHQPHRRLVKCKISSPPYGVTAVPEIDGKRVELTPPPRSGRRVHPDAPKDQGHRLLQWDKGLGMMRGELTRPSRPPKLPPSFKEGPHMDDLMDDERSRKLHPPRRKQRRHIPGYAGDIDEAISPVDDRQRRELRAREMHEFTGVKKDRTQHGVLVMASRGRGKNNTHEADGADGQCSE